MRGKREALIPFLRRSISCEFTPTASQLSTQPEPENISAKALMEVLNQTGNSEGLSFSDFEDWLNAQS